MYKIKTVIYFSLISKNKKHILGITSDSDCLSHALEEITFTLDPKYEFEKDIECVLALIKNTKDLRARINQYVNKYHDKSPALKKFSLFIDNLDENEKFYLLPAKKNVSYIQEIKLKESFSVVHHDKSSEDSCIKIFNSAFSEIMEQYNIIVVNPDGLKGKIKIGKAFKASRVCRFCNNINEKPTTFSKEAHAISESLGNKKIILNEECDLCNEYFDKNIERDIYKYLKVYSLFFRVKNKKNKVPKIKGKDFYLECINETIDGYDCDLDFSLMYIPTNPEKNNSEPPENIILVLNEKIRKQNIYKALVKFSLSVINDRKYLRKFNKTIKWIRSPTKFYEQLPNIAILTSYQFYCEQPYLCIYISKNKKTSIPYAVGEFHYTYLTYIFIIPLFENDEVEFIQQKDFDEFIKLFPQFKRIDDFVFENFSDYKEKEFKINIKLSQRNKD